MSHVIAVDDAGRVFVDGEALGTRLSRKPAEMLRAILRHSQVATRDHLLDTIYAGRDEPKAKIIDVLLIHIRRALGEHRGAVVTVWGRGYTRGDGYTLAPTHATVAVEVDARLLGEVAYASDETPAVLVERLLRAEFTALWHPSRMSKTA